jgi:hypothetical protein
MSTVCFPLNLLYELTTALTFENSGRARALNLLETVLIVNPKHGESLKVYGELLWEAGDYEGTNVMLQSAGAPSQKPAISANFVCAMELICENVCSQQHSTAS